MIKLKGQKTEKTEEQKKRRIIGTLVLFGGLALGLLLFMNMNRMREASLVTLTEASAAPVASGEVIVHVSGAVNVPGLVTLEDGARVLDAINAAGGFSDDALQDTLNFASLVSDGQKITVPRLGEEQQTGASLININSADAKTLQELPGIGEVMSQNIVDYRNKNGSFTSIEQLKDVPRIGDKLFEQVSALICV